MRTFITFIDGAKQAGLSLRQFRRRVQEGGVHVMKIKHKFFILQADLQRLMSTPRVQLKRGPKVGEAHVR